MCIIFGVSLLLGNNAFAEINFDTQDETLWYGPGTPSAVVSAVPEPDPIPVSISIIITQTRESH